MASGEAGGVIFSVILAVICVTVAAVLCPNGTPLSQYQGHVSVTDGGRPCQKWAKNKPHQHNFTEDYNYPLDDTARAAENYCRNVDNDPLPWCYTRDVNVRWQYCWESICGVEGPKCGGTVKSPSGELTSIDRNNDGLYDQYRDCLWVLKAPKGKWIRVSVLSMDVEKSENCHADFLQIYDSWVDHGKFCGNFKPIQLSHSNVVFVRWYSSGGDTGRGFKLHFSHVNRGDLNVTTEPYAESTNGDVPTTPPTHPGIHSAGDRNGGTRSQNRTTDFSMQTASFMTLSIYPRTYPWTSSAASTKMTTTRNVIFSQRTEHNETNMKSTVGDSFIKQVTRTRATTSRPDGGNKIDNEETNGNHEKPPGDWRKLEKTKNTSDTEETSTTFGNDGERGNSARYDITSSAGNIKSMPAMTILAIAILKFVCLFVMCHARF